MNEAVTLRSRFKDFIRRTLKISEDQRLLVAVSGGLDSMVLARMMQDVGNPVEWAHCNFSLRSFESDQDEIFVSQKAATLGLVCHTRRFNTKVFASEHGMSTQMAARELRYQWFANLLKERDLDFLATAHHKDDHLETVLFNQIKGTGLAGYHGILPISHHTIRPLLCFSRDELEQLANIFELDWREDSSNARDDYTRNYLRHHITPALRKLNPSVVETFWRNSNRIIQVESMVKKFVNDQMWRRGEMGDMITIDTSGLEHVEYGPLLIYEFLIAYGFTYDQSVQIHENLKGQSGKQFLNGQYILVVDRDQLIITPNKDLGWEQGSLYLKNLGAYEYNGYQLQVTYEEGSGAVIQEDPWIFQGDKDKIVWPLELRSWQEGDVFVPLGMKGKKKISDLMIDLKIPLNLKKRVMILKDQEGIIWMVGHRMANRVRITESTSTYLTIKADSL